MREIKFRGIPIRAKKENFVEGDLIKTADRRYFIFPYEADLMLSNLVDEIEGSVAIYSGFGLLIEINPETLGQYTGLKDKNGKEIYEGDIGKLHWQFFDDIVAIRNIFDVCYYELDEKCEVIGNIYENPELLKGD